jgi:hypothetical protein
MNEKIRSAVAPVFSMLTGAFLTLVFVPIAILGWQQVYDLYDRTNPPVTAKLASSERVGESLFIRFFVTRQADCDFIKAQGFSGTSTLNMQPSTMRRADGSDPISYPKGITVLSPTWEIKPIYGPVVRVYGYYDCVNRTVKTLLVDETLK